MLDQLEWSEDGQMLGISTQTGKLYVYLTKLPMLASTHGTLVANLAQLQEAVIGGLLREEAAERESIRVKLPTEPTCIGVGPYHFACAMNNSAWVWSLNEGGVCICGDSEVGGSLFHALTRGGTLNLTTHTGAEPLSTEPRSYNGSVQELHLSSEYMAALIEGKVQLEQVPFGCVRCPIVDGPQFFCGVG